jgi:transcriptional regulator with XRE-family HTH domain
MADRHAGHWRFTGRYYERTALIRARENLGLDRDQFAEMMGFNSIYVYKVETGRQDPSLAVMLRWIKALGPGATLDLFWTPQEGFAYKIA